MSAAIKEQIDKLEKEIEGSSRRRNGYAYLTDIETLISILRQMIDREDGDAMARALGK